MSMFGPTDAEIRVLGCLIEKQRATPDHYPLTLNSLRLACNQSTNRDPVVDYDEATVREALGRLGRRRWIRSASGHSSRVAKYRHLLEEELKLSGEEMSILAVLMLRGEQTPGELKQRTERLFGFADLDAVHLELEGLIERGYVERLPRRPGQKEERYRQLLGGEQDEDTGEGDTESAPQQGPVVGESFESSDGSASYGSPPTAAPSVAVGAADSDLSARVERLETELAELRRQFGELQRDAVGGEGDV